MTNIEARAQRDRDLRWKQADAGKKLNDEMLTDAEYTGEVLGYLKKYKLTRSLTFLNRYGFSGGDGPDVKQLGDGTVV